MRCVYGLDFQEEQKTFFAADTPVLPDSLPEAARQADYLAILSPTPGQEPLLQALWEALGPRLLVPRAWGARLPTAGVLIDGAISGGVYQDYLAQAAREAPGRCWLLQVPFSLSFPLPCPSGCGSPAPRPAEPGFYSPALGCAYLHNPAGFRLFDTEESTAADCDLARQAGFRGWLRVTADVDKDAGL